MFIAYFDASGDDHCQFALAVGGFVASADSWTEWEREWLDRLRNDGLECFHWTELNGWDVWRRTRLIDDLCSIIMNHVSAKSGAALINDDLRAQLSAAEREKWRIKSFSLAGRTVAKKMRIWASEWGGRMPELVFEAGDKGKGQLIHLLESQGYPSPIFRPKRTYRHKKSLVVIEGAVPLQAGDLLAYKLFAKARAIKQNPEASRDFSRLHPILDRIPGLCGVVTPNHLRFLKQGMEQIDSLVMTTDVKIRTK